MFRFIRNLISLMLQGLAIGIGYLGAYKLYENWDEIKYKTKKKINDFKMKKDES